MKGLLEKFGNCGHSMLETALLLALVAVTVILTVRMVGSRVAATHDNIQSQMETQGVTTSSPQDSSGTGGSSSGGSQKSDHGYHGHGSD